jgi:hypothetical protein
MGLATDKQARKLIQFQGCTVPVHIEKLPEVGKVTFKSNGDEALSNESP